MNKPFVRKDWEGSEVKPLPYIHQHPNRRARRKGPGRKFSNKKGPQVVITNWGRGVFTKVHKVLKYSPGRVDVIYNLIVRR